MLFIFYLEVLPRTSGEGDQDMKHYLHQPTTMVTDLNKDAQMIDNRLLHLFGGQINCYQNPYNGFPPPLSFHFLTPNGNLLYSIITFILKYFKKFCHTTIHVYYEIIFKKLYWLVLFKVYFNILIFIKFY